MRYLALDVGDERIGVAISDRDGHLARPLEVIPRRAGPTSYQRIAQIVAENEVQLIVVGLPLLPSGSEGKQVRSTQAYIEGLGVHVHVPIQVWDERGSTRRASQILLENDSRRRRRKESSDAVAAAVILQEYLDAKSGGRPW
jgi:putative Holliday junction resolvase